MFYCPIRWGVSLTSLSQVLTESSGPALFLFYCFLVLLHRQEMGLKCSNVFHEHFGSQPYHRRKAEDMEGKIYATVCGVGF